MRRQINASQNRALRSRSAPTVMRKGSSPRRQLRRFGAFLASGSEITRIIREAGVRSISGGLIVRIPIEEKIP